MRDTVKTISVADIEKFLDELKLEESALCNWKIYTDETDRKLKQIRIEIKTINELLFFLDNQ